MQAELGFDPNAPAPAPHSPARAARGGKGGPKGKGSGGQDASAEVEEEDPSGLRFLAKAGVVVVEAPACSGVFVVDPKQSRIDPSAGTDRTLM